MCKDTTTIIRPIFPRPGIDSCLLEQHNKQVDGFEMELLDASHSIATIEHTKELPNKIPHISDAIFSIGLNVSKLLSYATEASITPFREGIYLLNENQPSHI